MVDTSSVAELIKAELEKPSIKTWIGGEVQVSTLRTYRDFKAHTIANCPVSFDIRACLASFCFNLLCCAHVFFISARRTINIAAVI